MSEPPTVFDPSDWAGVEGKIGTYIQEECGRTLQSYRAQPNLVLEHANHEQDTARGGYADRQLFELVQNGADALSNVGGGRIELRLTGTHFYCADSGQGIDTDGVRALMFSYLSPKRGTSEIGRFGLGFKSVLGVSDSPEFFSRSGSFRFDRNSSQQMIERQVRDNTFDRYPVLRLAMPVDPDPAAANDPILRNMMQWANNVVRLPLIEGAYEKISEQSERFPSEFLLFVRHVSLLEIRNDLTATHRTLELDQDQDVYLLSDDGAESQWRVFHRMHALSDDAKADSRTLDDAHEVPISWATPLEGSNPERTFWAFFPTTTPSLVPGILNAPWKTNEDRQNLLTGVFNDELVTASAELIADNLHRLSTEEDPARHLDALPRRVRQVDRGHTVKLSEELFTKLYGRPLIPDTSAELRRFSDVKFPPEIVMRRRRGYDANLDAALDRWYGADQLPEGWLDESATNVSRWPFIERLCDPDGLLKTDNGVGTPATLVSEWLEAIVENASPSALTEASKVAILVASDLPNHEDFGDARVADVVLTQSGTLVDFLSDVYLPTDGFQWAPDRMVHGSLSIDAEARHALSSLGIREASAESRFALLLDSLLGDTLDEQIDPVGNHWHLLWRACRGVNPEDAASLLERHSNWRSKLRLQTINGEWRPINRVLYPGAVVPQDGTRDIGTAVDLDYHREDGIFLQKIGLADRPSGLWHFDTETDYLNLQKESIAEFQKQAIERRGENPQVNFLKFSDVTGVGPTELLSELSVEGKARFTELALLNGATFVKWTMRHTSRHVYGTIETPQPIIGAIKRHGMIAISTGFVPFSDALGEKPKSREAQKFLLDHPNAEKIKEAFDLHDAPTGQLSYAINATPAIRITEAWPGLSQHLGKEHRGCKIIHCDAIHDEYGEDLGWSHVKIDDDIIAVYMDREDELDAITDELNILLNEGERSDILNQLTPEEIQTAREAVREQPDTESKLLQAVGEEGLLEGLPNALTAYYSRNGRQFAGKEVARAAISTYHTNALKEYRHALAHLDPPKQWAGSRPAIQFVTSLGFSPEWAGERGVRRDPFLEVPGPIELPPLHSYQRIVVEKLRQMLHSADGIFGERRGMVSLPTGSGKTRVAVEGIVTSITEDDFEGGVLWVADRDELCEQAVQAWQEVWRAMGPRDQILRVSRMWQGQPPPMAAADRHVVVASVQTLSSKFSRQNSDYDFLRDFSLIVFDEAHRSIAPTFTSVMEELGFRVRSGEKEPLLLGLTATPYRGYSETETRWLANRYGQNRLDRGAFLSDDADKVMRELQEMQILARATHMEIEGSEFTLSEQERIQAMETPWLSPNTEIRIARDAERTERIIEAYKEHIASQPETWPTLIFATSVEHAQTLAAILSADGISARAVSGGTDRYTRRQVVEDFRSGELNVLVNYGVFREGFDAPKTRAIIVARPVYSPNLYFQMIGRGLRGIKNGGNDRCLILDVRDNIKNFNRHLAFTELDWLWD